MSTQKTITYYECDICHRQYDTSAKAAACEASHGTLVVDSARFEAIDTMFKEFPASVIISNGTSKAKYTYYKRVADET